MTAEELFEAIGTADETFLEHSERRGKRRPIPWQGWAAACLCLIALAAGTRWKDWKEAIDLYKATHIEGGCSVEFPGGIDPVLRVSGRLYQWTGLENQGGLRWDEDGMVYGSFAVPEGFEAAGEITSVTQDPPVQDFQIQAGTPIRGTVYTNPEAPLVVYAQVSTDWLENCCVRFVSEDYRSGMIRVGGKLYSWYAETFYSGGLEYDSRLDELPQGAVYVGAIENVVEDRYPVRDLEASNDSWHVHMMGREIYQCPSDDSVIYVRDEQRWSGGTNYYWRVCRLWEGTE